MSAKLMANRSDRHFANLSNCQGTKARSPDQEKVRGFPSWPGAQCGSFKRPDTRPQPEDQSKAATLRTDLGPYTTVRIQLPPPSSLPCAAFSGTQRAMAPPWTSEISSLSPLCGPVPIEPKVGSTLWLSRRRSSRVSNQLPEPNPYWRSFPPTGLRRN